MVPQKDNSASSYILAYICCRRESKRLFHKQHHNIEKLLSISGLTKFMALQIFADEKLD